MKCKRCEKELTGQQTSYCGWYCSKLHLKSLYRKRQAKKIKEYNRLYRKNNYAKNLRQKHIEQNSKCEKCERTTRLEIHHIKPLSLGGENKPSNLITLCQKHHREFEVFSQQFFS
jgi:5-methylcytosine-specific restriction endonuclease McrA